MIRGIVPALITPMNQDGSAVDIAAVRALVDFLLARGVSGFFVCGGTGEGLLLTPTEQLKAAQDEKAVVAYSDVLNRLFGLGAADTARRCAVREDADHDEDPGPSGAGGVS